MEQINGLREQALKLQMVGSTGHTWTSLQWRPTFQEQWGPENCSDNPSNITSWSFPFTNEFQGLAEHVYDVSEIFSNGLKKSSFFSSDKQVKNDFWTYHNRMGGFSALLNIFNRLIPRSFPRTFHTDSSNKRKISYMEILLRIAILGNLEVYNQQIVLISCLITKR